MRKIFFIHFTFLLFLNCGKVTTPQDPIPTYETFTIDSKSVQETRVINVWTPSNYGTSSDSLFVLYMPDGGIKEDFPHIANTLAELIENKSIPPMILVGIENTERRRDLSGPSETKSDSEVAPMTDGAKLFRAFVLEELMPEINKRYRTTTKKGIIGESLAGLFVVETFLLHPEAFDYYIAFDPSLWWNSNKLQRNAATYLASFPNEPKTLWFAGSDAADMNIHTKALAKTFTEVNLEQLRWTYSDEPNEQHNTIFRATKKEALIWTFSGEVIPTQK
jgi:predicted alpha/beta superfamily hydrolase